MPDKEQEKLNFATRYAAAVVFAALAVALRWALDPWLGDRIPYVTLFAAVAGTVWLCGYRPALVAMVLGYAAAELLYDDTRGSIALDAVNLASLAAYAFSCGLVILFGERARRAHQSAEAPREELQSIFDAAPVVILVAHDAHCRRITGNRYAYQMFGLPEGGNISRTAPQGERMTYRILRDNVEIPVGELPLQRATAEGRAVYDQEMEFAFEGRPSVTVTGSAVPLRDDAGRVRGAIGIYTDITQRKKADELLRLLTDNIPALIAYVDRTFHYRLNNRVYGSWFGDDRTDVTGKAVRDVLGEAGWEKVRPYMEAAMGGEHVSYETEIKANGQTRWVSACYVPHFGPSGEVEGIALFASDLTDRHKGEQALKKTVEELARVEAALREADRRKDEFLATLAHELRNPLAPMRTAVEIVQRLATGDERMRSSWEIVDRQVRHMTRLVDDLLDMARITRGKIRLRKQPVELGDLLREAVESARPFMDRRKQVVEVSLAPEPIRLFADPTRITQVVSNLLHNAGKFTPTGGHLRLTSSVEGGMAVISVRDNGRGIAPEHLSRLFEMFAQVSPALERSEQGLGIGLSLVRGLVELHGGKVEAHSEGSGRGSEFVVRLPIATGNEDKEATTTLPPEAASATQARRILVVDDNQDAADSLGAILQIMGHDTVIAYDGAEALRKAGTAEFDTVLLDIGMPGMNGYEVARRMRSLPRGADLRLVALTGWGQEEDKRRATEAGFDFHLTKPVDAGAVAALLRQ